MESIIGVGEYRKQDYQEILRLSDDRENMDETWEAWKANKNKGLKNFHQMGLKTIDIMVYPRELVKYCREKGLRINGESRANFISFKVMEMDQG
ncbi:MAG: hypothetical protein AAGJ93_14705 [Bacteroidota bacterium]